jgi:DNA sulfur modification protein DndE
MSFNRIRISEEATKRLRILKARTGLTPNYLSRIAFCYSLNDPRVPDPSKYKDDGQEFNRYTLTGEYDGLFMAILKERLIDDGLDPEKDLLPQFKAHINRGVLAIYSRVKSIGDLENLLPSTN